MQFDNEYISLVATVSNDFSVVEFQGRVKNPGSYKSMEIMAAHPIDRMTNYSGSGLPWPCPNFAFDNTPSRLQVSKDGSFQGKFRYPNSYYTYDAFEKIPPSLFALLYDNSGKTPIVVRIGLNEPDILKMRTLTYRNRNAGPAFYAVKEQYMGILPTTAEEAMLTLKAFKPRYNIA